MKESDQQNKNNGDQQKNSQDTPDNKKKQTTDSSSESTIRFCGKNMKYISAGVVFLLLIIVMGVGINSRGQKKTEGTAQAVVSQPISEQDEAVEETDKLEKNAHKEVNELIERYYKACASGDEAELKACAQPISAVELSYRKVCGKYIKSYKNIDVYTKPGKNEGDYIVSAYYEMKLDNVKTLAPGLDMFYVEKQKDGSYLLNNAYTTYNLQNQEYEIDKEMQALLDEYEQEEEVQNLITEVQKKYDDAIGSDSKLEDMITNTFKKAVQEWAKTKDDIKETADADEKASDKKEDKTSDKKEDKTSEESSTDSESSKKKEKNEEESKKQDKKASDESTSESKDSDSDNKDKDTKKKDSEQEKKKSSKKKEEQNQSETVYATSNVNVRKEPREDADVIALLDQGTPIVRTGKTEDGWSIVEYNGETAYVKSDYLSTEEPAQEQQAAAPVLESGKTIHLTQTITVRNGIGEDKAKVGTAFVGDDVTVIESLAEGWTKIRWNGIECYAKTEVIK